MGAALSTFNDFMTATGPAIYTGPEQVVNEAVRQNYLLRRFLRGKEGTSVIQGGSKIKDMIMLDEDSTFQYYQPNETFTWRNPDILTEWAIDWRFAVDHMAWTDQEVELNSGGGLSRGGRFQVYKDLKRSKEQRLYTSFLNGIEDALFAVPNTNTMEAAAGTNPYSLFAYFNQGEANLWGATDGGSNEHTNKFDTLQTIDPEVKTKWQIQESGYTNSSTTTAGLQIDDTNAGLLAAFDNMYYKVKFQAPPTQKEYFESDSLFRQVIMCSRLGINTYAAQRRASQNRFAAPSMQDPAFLKPTYGGIEVEYVAGRDSAAVYPEPLTAVGVGAAADRHDNAAVTHFGTPALETASTGATGPRYYWVNANYMNIVFHSSRYMVRHDVMRHPIQPFTSIQPIDCWYNLVSKSRNRQGLVSPNTKAS